MEIIFLALYGDDGKDQCLHSLLAGAKNVESLCGAGWGFMLVCPKP